MGQVLRSDRIMMLILLVAASTLFDALINASLAADGGSLDEAASPRPFGSSSTGNLAYGLAAVPFFVRDVLLLRALAVVTAVLVIVFNLTGLVAANGVLVLSMAVVIVVNLSRIIHLLIEKRRVSLNPEERALFETLFRELTPVEFMKLLRIGHWRTARAGQTLTREGEDLDELMLIGRGEVIVERDHEEVARAREGAIIGEMSFLQGGRATATVRAARPTRYLSWPRRDLSKLLRRNPAMDVAMKSVLNLDLVRKLAARGTTAGPTTMVGQSA